MGFLNSLGLVVLVCVYFEYCMYYFLGIDNKFINGICYIDDNINIVVYKKNDNNSKI